MLLRASTRSGRRPAIWRVLKLSKPVLLRPHALNAPRRTEGIRRYNITRFNVYSCSYTLQTSECHRNIIYIMYIIILLVRIIIVWYRVRAQGSNDLRPYYNILRLVPVPILVVSLQTRVRRTHDDRHCNHWPTPLHSFTPASRRIDDEW